MVPSAISVSRRDTAAGKIDVLTCRGRDLVRAGSVRNPTDTPASARVTVRVMGCRLADADSIDDIGSRPVSIRPLVLLAIDNDEVRARFAYDLTASGFDVAMTGFAAGLRRANRPDVIVAALNARWSRRDLSVGHPSTDRHLLGIPVVAVAGDASATTRDLARREGCAAVCLSTCSGAALAAGIRAVLGRR
jgi:hypothetical protein